MRNGVDFWCFSVSGKPLSKKRVRFVSRYARFTSNEWYEKMVADAFHRAFPASVPYGSEYYNVSVRKTKYGVSKVYHLKKGYSRSDVPLLRPYMFFYFNNGTIGDVDNYVKIVQDALNKVAYVDDFQIRVPTPYIVIDPDEIERVDVLLVPYNPDKDKHFATLKDFVTENSKYIDIYDEYEIDRLHEHSVAWLKAEFCDGCRFENTCNVRRKDDVIFCKNHKK